jgi:acyl-coenzyme A synthetase/AMP-(fatty) acid ligase/acyl carrier protein
VALVDERRCLTYEQLADRVDDLAARLGGERKLVALRAANDIESVCAYLGCLAAGHPVMLLADDDHAAATAGLYDVDVTISPGEDGPVLNETRSESAHRLHPELALLLGTSGSTGSPKLVRLSRENIDANARSIAQYLGLTSADRAITSLPMRYCYGLSVINSHLAVGASLVLTELSVVDGCFWRLFEQHGCTSFAGVPHTFDLLDRAGFDRRDPPSLRYVTQAGGRLDPDRVRRYARLGRERGWDFFVMYGQTEATARMAYLPPALAESNPGSVGIAIPGGELTIDQGAAPAAGQPGELVYRGPNVMLGYAESAGDLARGRTVNELRTGDLARVGDGGLVEIVGRKNRFLKLFGLRIDLSQVEQSLCTDGVTAACAGDDTRLDVVFERGAGHDAQHVAGRVTAITGLPAGSVNTVELDQLPRLATGKLDYRAVTDLGRTATGTKSPGAPREGLRELFRSVLRCDEVTGQSTFVSLGGDSLSYVEMSLALEEELGQLPADWHVTPIERLEQLERVPQGSRLRGVETSVLLRAVATILIVATHIRVFSLPGSAHVLLALAGYNFARFLMAPSDRVERLKGQARSILRIALPSIAWIAAAAAVSGAYGLSNVLLLNSIVGSEQWDDLWHFWFIEVLIYVMIAMTLITTIPVVARTQRHNPFAFAMGLVMIGLVMRFRVIEAGLLHTKAVFWLFALGWAAWAATSAWQRIVVSMIALISVPGFFGDIDREIVIAAGFLALVWVPSVSIPVWLSRPVAVLAASSLYVYLVQWQVFPLFPNAPLAALIAALAAGVAYFRIVSLVMPRVERGAGLAAAGVKRATGLTRSRTTELGEARAPA